MKLLVLALLPIAVCLLSAEDYKGPRPPKPDIPYLLHADVMVQTEVVTASEENRKNEVAYTIPGVTSPARTPLAEPVFIMESRSISAEQIEAFRLDVKNGHR